MNCCKAFLPIITTMSASFLAGQTCPAINLQSTPRIVAPDKQVVVTMRQPDGSFMGYFGPRIAPLLLGSTVPNLQNTITSCFPVSNKKGSAPFSSNVRAGWSSYIGDYADLDGDGVLDGALIAYKPNAVYIILMGASYRRRRLQPRRPGRVGRPRTAARGRVRRAS